MIDMDDIIKRLESLRDICNARSDIFVGDARIIWAGYGRTVSDAIELIENQKRIYLALEKDWKELRNHMKEETKMDINMYVMKKMEEKLIELMGREAYEEFSIGLAKEGFRKEVDGMANGEFKNFCIEHFDDITK